MVHLAWDALQHHPGSVLDVGPGHGKYGLLLREYVDPTLVIDAVEMEPSYVTPRLRAIYDTIYGQDVCDAQGPLQIEDYSVVLMIDVIEHIKKDAALELLDEIPGYVIVCTPVDFFQNPPTVPSEVHRSHWTLEDFGDRVDQDASQHAGILLRLRPL